MIHCKRLMGLASNVSVFVILINSPAALAAQASSLCKFPVSHLGGPVDAHTRFIENNLLPAIMQAGTKPFTLEERMRAYGVPGVSVAVVHNGKLQWARGWGVRDTKTCSPVTPQTHFQAASISKVITALVALRLVERGQINLDSDINSYLCQRRFKTDTVFVVPAI